jgi:hypothetical protein
MIFLAWWDEDGAASRKCHAGGHGEGHRNPAQADRASLSITYARDLSVCARAAVIDFTITTVHW